MLAAGALPQVDTGTIRGLVRDASGAGIPGVQVKITDEGTLQTGSGTLSNLRPEQAVKDLPLNSRNFPQLITLSAGATPAQSQTTGSRITMKRGSSGVSINGTRRRDVQCR